MRNDSNDHDGARPPAFPELPIITVDPAPKRSEGEKYGGLYYLGIAGLIVVVALVAWFGYSAWSLRDVWRNVFILHDETRPETDRVRAALALSRDIRVNAQQRWDIALRKPLPPLARYLIAESLTPEIVTPDPDAFGKIVAHSDDWPGWLRIQGVRLMAVSAAGGTNFPASALDRLAEDEDPAIVAFVEYIRSVSSTPDRRAAARLSDESKSDRSVAPLAGMLTSAIEAGSFDRTEKLAEATRWLRDHDPAASKVWEGWAERGEDMVRIRP